MFFAASALSLLALGASAAPTKRAVTDTDVLQYALTLEHLENKFYSDALAKFDTAAFEAAGFPSWVRGRFSQIAEHEASHVAVLAGALGSAATQPCEYSFPYNDVASFAALSQVIENVGVSAYLGAAGFITEKAYLGVAASILTTEARHQGWVSSAVNKQEGWSGPYDTALGLSQVYSIAAGFITSCPSSNPALPVKAFPSLVIAPAASGSNTQLTFKTTGQSESLYVYKGLAVVEAPIAVAGTATIPANLQGISYALVAPSGLNATSITDDNIIAGPAILDYPFTAYVSNPMFTGM